MPVMENIMLLRKDLRAKGCVITTFLFPFNEDEYCVIFEDIKAVGKETSKFALVKLTFIDLKNEERKLEAEANTVTFLLEPEIIRKYFHIPYIENGVHDALKNLYRCFQKHTPSQVSPAKKEIHHAALHYICKNDEDPDAVYCYRIMRNGINPVNKKQGRRSEENSKKTSILYPTLYGAIHDDTTISFCYSKDPKKYKSYSDLQILLNNILSK